MQKKEKRESTQRMALSVQVHHSSKRTWNSSPSDSIHKMSVCSNSGPTFWIDQDESSQVGYEFDDDGQSDFVLVIQEV